MTFDSQPKSGISNDRWKMALVISLMVLIPSLWLVASYIAVRTAKEMRVRLSLDRNISIAQLVARLIDEQADGATSTMDVFVKRFPFLEALEKGDKASISRYLSLTVDIVPDLQSVSAYDASGDRIAQYPADGENIPDTVYKQWSLKSLALEKPYFGEIVRLKSNPNDEAIAVLYPVIRKHRLRGQLVAFFRLRQIEKWLANVRFGTLGRVYVVANDGRVVTSTSSTKLKHVDLSTFPAFRLGLQGIVGSQISTEPTDGKMALIGYARAGIPNWAVIATQPVESALSPTTYLIRQLSVWVLPILGLMVGLAALVARLYTAQRRLMLDLARNNDKLVAADRAKSDFLANVSHDLRTPLAGLQVSVSGLLDPSVKWQTDQVRETLMVANEELEQLTRRVRNLLEMSRLEAEVQTHARETADLIDVVGTAVERIQPLLDGRIVEAKFPNEPIFVSCDHGQIVTAITNLLENAIKYSPAGSTIHLQGGTDSGQAWCSIEDEGPGVSPEERSLIFNKFYRSFSAGGTAGTGLGLAICQSIMQSHGGSVSVEQGSLGGALFRISLPLLASTTE